MAWALAGADGSADSQLDGFQEGAQEIRKNSEGKDHALAFSVGADFPQIRCIDLYMDEKVSKRSFADNRPVDALLKEIEDEYTARFGTSTLRSWGYRGLIGLGRA